MSITTTSIQGYQLAWTRTGPESDDPVLVLHGLGDSAIMTFAPLFRTLPLATTPALFLDLPGFGFSPSPLDGNLTIEHLADVVAGFIAQHGLRAPLRIVAHSMGGDIAILLAQRHPHLVRALILAEPMTRPGDSLLAAIIARDSLEQFLTRGYPKLVRATRRQTIRGDRAAASFLRPLEQADPQSILSAATSLMAERSPSFGEILCDLSADRGLIVGERTIFRPEPFARAGIPITIVLDAAHAMMAENPTAFVAAVAAYLEQFAEEKKE